MHAKDANIGARIAFKAYVGIRNDEISLTGIVEGAPTYQHRRWFVPVALDNPNELVGPGIALPEDWEVSPAG